MMTDEKKNFLCVVNDNEDEQYKRKRYVDMIVDRKTSEYTSDDEHALMRKWAKFSLDILTIQFPGIAQDPLYQEVKAYFEYYERRKAEASALLEQASG